MALTDEVRSALRALHPEAEPVDLEALLKGTPPTTNPVVFESITSDSIRFAALRTSGGSGPSGRNAEHWKRILVSHKGHSARLRDALAAFARRLCTDLIHADLLCTFLANQVLALEALN